MPKRKNPFSMSFSFYYSKTKIWKIAWSSLPLRTEMNKIKQFYIELKSNLELSENIHKCWFLIKEWKIFRENQKNTFFSYSVKACETERLGNFCEIFTRSTHFCQSFQQLILAWSSLSLAHWNRFHIIISFDLTRISDMFLWRII